MLTFGTISFQAYLASSLPGGSTVDRIGTTSLSGPGSVFARHVVAPAVARGAANGGPRSMHRVPTGTTPVAFSDGKPRMLNCVAPKAGAFRATSKGGR